MPFQISSAVSAKPEEFAVLLGDHAFIGKEVEIDGSLPIIFAHKGHRHLLELLCLNEC